MSRSSQAHPCAGERRAHRRAEGGAASGWFAARPSGTEDIYKIYAESFKSPAHLQDDRPRGAANSRRVHRRLRNQRRRLRHDVDLQCRVGGRHVARRRARAPCGRCCSPGRWRWLCGRRSRGCSPDGRSRSRSRRSAARARCARARCGWSQPRPPADRPEACDG